MNSFLWYIGSPRLGKKRKTMNHPNLFLLYVDQPAVSKAFYRKLLAREPVEESEGFALFPLNEGGNLAVWSSHVVKPEVTGKAGGSELVIQAESKEAVEALYLDWKNQGIPIAQIPTQMEFGYTFVGLDPDGHRLRVLTA